MPIEIEPMKNATSQKNVFVFFNLEYAGIYLMGDTSFAPQDHFNYAKDFWGVKPVQNTWNQYQSCTSGLTTGPL